MLYDYSTEYEIKHSAACYGVDINNKGKPRVGFNLLYQVEWANSNGSGEECFILQFFPCKWNQPWPTPSQYPVLDKRFYRYYGCRLL